jgi:hypothetical protein
MMLEDAFRECAAVLDRPTLRDVLKRLRATGRFDNLSDELVFAALLYEVMAQRRRGTVKVLDVEYELTEDGKQ